ncbi:hypothetical protein HDU96_006858 [Phlyctochytrium bullatum]|nr:hypothetical protein HDU96_006858 [Phlyctochytrium bullatum]
MTGGGHGVPRGLTMHEEVGGRVAKRETTMKGRIRKSHRAFETIDFEEPDNVFYRKHYREQSIKAIIIQEAMQYFLAAVITFLIALFFYVLFIGTELVGEYRVKAYSLIVSRGNAAGALGFALWTALLVTLVPSFLIIAFAPDAVGSGMSDVIAYLNGSHTINGSNLILPVIRYLGSFGIVVGGMFSGIDGPMARIGAALAIFLTRQMRRFSLTRLAFYGMMDEELEATSGGLKRAVATKAFLDVLEQKRLRIFATLGASVAITVIFRAPLGGVLFAIEETTSFYEPSLLLRTLFSTIIGYMILLGFVRNGAQTSTEMFVQATLYPIGSNCTLQPNFYDYFTYILLGVLAALLGTLWNKLLALVQHVRVHSLMPEKLLRGKRQQQHSGSLLTLPAAPIAPDTPNPPSLPDQPARAPPRKTSVFSMDFFAPSRPSTSGPRRTPMGPVTNPPEREKRASLEDIKNIRGTWWQRAAIRLLDVAVLAVATNVVVVLVPLIPGLDPCVTLERPLDHVRASLPHVCEKAMGSEKEETFSKCIKSFTNVCVPDDILKYFLYNLVRYRVVLLNKNSTIITIGSLDEEAAAKAYTKAFKKLKHNTAAIDMDAVNAAPPTTDGPGYSVPPGYYSATPTSPAPDHHAAAAAAAAAAPRRWAAFAATPAIETVAGRPPATAQPRSRHFGFAKMFHARRRDEEEDEEEEEDAAAGPLDVSGVAARILEIREGARGEAAMLGLADPLATPTAQRRLAEVWAAAGIDGMHPAARGFEARLRRRAAQVPFTSTVKPTKGYIPTVVTANMTLEELVPEMYAVPKILEYLITDAEEPVAKEKKEEGEGVTKEGEGGLHRRAAAEGGDKPEPTCYYPLRTLLYATPDKQLRLLLNRGLYNLFPATSLGVFFGVYTTFSLITYYIALPTDLVIPNLIIGAGAGRLVGLLLNYIKTSKGLYPVDPGLFSMIGMAAMWSGTSRLAVTVAIITLELTGDFSNMTATLLVCLTAAWLSTFFEFFHWGRDSLYHSEMHGLGVLFLPQEPARELKTTTVASVARLGNINYLKETGATVEDARRCLATSHNGFPVCREEWVEELPDGSATTSVNPARGTVALGPPASAIASPVSADVLMSPTDAVGGSLPQPPQQGGPVLKLRPVGIIHRGSIVALLEGMVLEERQKAHARVQQCLADFTARLTAGPGPHNPDAQAAVSDDTVLDLAASPRKEEFVVDVEADEKEKQPGAHPRFEDFGAPPPPIPTAVNEDDVDIDYLDPSMPLDLDGVFNVSPTVVREDASADKVYRIVRQMGVRHVLVVDGNAHLVGIVTRKNLVAKLELSETRRSGTVGGSLRGGRPPTSSRGTPSPSPPPPTPTPTPPPPHTVPRNLGFDDDLRSVDSRGSGRWSHAASPLNQEFPQQQPGTAAAATPALFELGDGTGSARMRRGVSFADGDGGVVVPVSTGGVGRGSILRPEVFQAVARARTAAAAAGTGSVRSARSARSSVIGENFEEARETREGRE